MLVKNTNIGVFGKDQVSTSTMARVYDGLYRDGKWVDYLSLSGRISLSGSINISGICSRHTAVGLVRHEVLKALEAQTKQYFAAHRFGL